jgi:transposase
MKPKVTTLRKQRLFSEEFKRSVVNEFESGQYSVIQLERLYKVKSGVIYRWIYKYSTFNEKSVRIIEMKESKTHRIKELEEKIKQLERMVGQKQLYIEYIERMMEIAKDELGIDIKKNSNTPQSNGSEKIKKR